MGNNKETRARRNEWERTFPRLFACFRACVECMRSHGGNFSFLEGVFFLIYDIVSRASTVDEGGADQTRFLDRIPAWTSIDSTPLATILGRVRFLWWYFWLEKRGWNVSRAFRIASFGIKSIRDLRRDIIFRLMTNDETWRRKPFIATSFLKMREREYFNRWSKF